MLNLLCSKGPWFLCQISHLAQLRAVPSVSPPSETHWDYMSISSCQHDCITVIYYNPKLLVHLSRHQTSIYEDKSPVFCASGFVCTIVDRLHLSVNQIKFNAGKLQPGGSKEIKA